MKGYSSCNIEEVDLFTIICADVSMTVLIICYLSLACLCIRIYLEIRQLQVRRFFLLIQLYGCKHGDNV